MVTSSSWNQPQRPPEVTHKLRRRPGTASVRQRMIQPVSFMLYVAWAEPKRASVCWRPLGEAVNYQWLPRLVIKSQQQTRGPEIQKLWFGPRTTCVPDPHRRLFLSFPTKHLQFAVREHLKPSFSNRDILMDRRRLRLLLREASEVSTLEPGVFLHHKDKHGRS